jgi:hypothetical protein
MEIRIKARKESLLMCWMRGEKDVCGKCDEKDCEMCERICTTRAERDILRDRHRIEAMRRKIEEIVRETF